MLQIAERELHRIAVIDDDELVRDTYKDAILDMGLEAVLFEEPLGSLDEALAKVAGTDAVLSDHHLSPSGYCGFNGAEFVAQLYRKQQPAVLCTEWGQARPHELSPFRQWVPRILQPPPEPDDIRSAIELCLSEFAGEFPASRRTHRTLVRVVEVRSHGLLPTLEMVIPGWNPNLVVARPLQVVPEELQGLLVEDARLHAQVNLGAESEPDLFFRCWEAE